MHLMDRYAVSDFLIMSDALILVQVVGEAQGSEDALKDFVEYLHQGPSAADVTKVSQSDIETKSGETGFGQE